MKKNFLLICLLITFVFPLSAQQKVAVLEFVAGAGVSQQDIEGLSNIFTTYFSPQGYTLVERNQINKVIEDLGFQKSNLTEKEYLRIGQVLNLTAMVLGNINFIMGEYNVDVRLVAAGDGKILAKAGAAFTGNSYRTNMQTLANKLSTELVNVSGHLKTPEPEFVDLGLPSGTFWAKENIKEDGRTFFNGDYKAKGGAAVPTYANWQELFSMCIWVWDQSNHDFLVTGKNGNSIRIPAVGDYWGNYIGEKLYYITRTSSFCYRSYEYSAAIISQNSAGKWCIEDICNRWGCLRLVK